MTYRAAPLTQRDGSALASSNCRAASVAVGIDYETAGETLSSSSAMRARMPDQSGGTDSGDAAAAWHTYGADLDIRDGDTFDDALAALRAGKLVHLDVWHASAAGPCLSGSGGYGHTMAVAPEASSDRWLTCDPWCSPASWQWWPESWLRAGAEEWGARVYRTAALDPEYATAGPSLRRIIVRRVVHELMDRYRPGGREAADPSDTGGNAGGSILFTTTNAGGGGGDDVRFVSSGSYAIDSGMRVNVGEGASWYYLDGTKGGTFSADAALRCLGLPDADGGAFAVVITTGSPYPDKLARDTVVMIRTSNSAYPAPEVPPPTAPDCDELISERDADWREWILEGSPGWAEAHEEIIE